MAQKEIYRLDIKIGVDGDSEAKKKLSATERFAQQSEKKIKALDKIKANPSVRLEDKLSGPLEKVEGKLSSFKKTVATEITALIGLGASTKAAMDFEKGMFKANTIARLSKDSLNALSKETLNLSNDTGVVAKDLAEMEYNALSASVAIEDLTNVVKTSSTLSKGGFADANDSLKLLTSTYNVYREEFEKMGVSQSKASEMIADKMINVQNLGVTTVGELSTQLGNITPIAKNANLTLDDLSASMIVLTKNGLGTSEAVTGMKAALSNIIKPSEQAMEMAGALGIEFSTTAIKSKGFEGFLKDLREKLKGTNPALVQAADKVSKYQHMIDGASKSQKSNKALMRQWQGELKSAKNELKVLTKSGGETTGVLAQLFGSVEGLGAVLSLTSEYGMKDFENGLEASRNALGSTKAAADMMGETRAEKFEKAINKLKNVGIELGIKLLPIIEKVSSLISSLADRFNSLNPATQDFIIKVGLASIALKPFTGIIGSLGKGVDKLISKGPKFAGFFKLFSGAKAVKGTTEAVTAVKAASTLSSVAGAASSIPIYGASGQILKTVAKDASAASKVAKVAGTAAKEVGVLGLAAKAGAILLNPWTLGIAAAAIAGGGLYKHLKKEAVPTVDLFAEKIEYGSKKIIGTSGEVGYEMTKTTKKISSGTKEAISAYMDMDKKVGARLTSLYANSTKINKDIKEEITGSYNEMGQEIKKGIDKQYSERLSLMQDLFSKNKTISQKDQQDTLKSMENGNKAKKAEIDNYINDAAKIMEQSSKNGGKITLDQQKKLDLIQSEMREKAVTHLSATEMESKIILERLKSFSDRLSTEQASNAIQEAEKTRIKAVDEANAKYLGIKSAIEYERDVTRRISPETAQILIDEADRQKREAIISARDMKEEVVEQIRQMNQGIADKIADDGHIKKIWEEQRDWFNKHPLIRTIQTIQDNEFKMSGDDKEKVDAVSGAAPSKILKKKGGKALGSNNVSPGVYEVAERGFEIVVGRQTRLFHGGERVLNNRESKKFLQSGINKNNETYVESPKIQFPVARPQLAMAGGGNNVNVGVNVENNFENDVDVESIIAEATKEFAYKLRESLKNIKK